MLAHIFAVDGYNFVSNTISDLGAQGYSRAFIMRTGFAAFGIIIALGMFATRLRWRALPVLFWGLGISAAALFSTQPFYGIPVVPYSTTQSSLHSLFATISGISLSIGIFLQVFYTRNTKKKLTHLAFFGAIIGLSSLFAVSGTHQGLTQRLLYVVGLVWFAFFFYCLMEAWDMIATDFLDAIYYYSKK